MLMPGLDTYFLELSARVSLKGSTKGSSGGKKIQKFNIVNPFFLKKKRRSETKKIEVFLFNLECSCLVQIHIF